MNLTRNDYQFLAICIMIGCIPGVNTTVASACSVMLVWAAIAALAVGILAGGAAAAYGLFYYGTKLATASRLPPKMTAVILSFTPLALVTLYAFVSDLLAR